MWCFNTWVHCVVKMFLGAYINCTMQGDSLLHSTSGISSVLCYIAPQDVRL
jgi:hypothetical protein